MILAIILLVSSSIFVGYCIKAYVDDRENRKIAKKQRPLVEINEIFERYAKKNNIEHCEPMDKMKCAREYLRSRIAICIMAEAEEKIIRDYMFLLDSLESRIK